MSDRACLGELVSVQRGQSYKSSYLGEPGPYLLGLGTIARNGGFRADNLRTYGGPTTEKILLHPGDLYVSLKDVTHAADLLGAVARVPTSIGVARLTQDTVRLDVISRRIDVDFLYWQLRAPQYRRYCRTRGTGTTNLDLSRADFFNYEFWLPSRDAQRAIVSILAALDDKIEANDKLTVTADALCAAIVRESQDPIRTERLGDVAEIVMGSSPSGKTMNEDEEGLPFYQGVRDFGLRFPTRRVWTSAPTRTAHGGDILVSVRAPVGTVNYAPESLCIGRGLAAVRSRTDQQSTLFHLLRSVRPAWAEYDSGGTVFGSINRDQLHNIEIPAIRSDAVARCEAEVHSVEQRLASALRENESLAVLRDSVLPKLMSGQLRVAEAMEVVAL